MVTLPDGSHPLPLRDGRRDALGLGSLIKGRPHNVTVIGRGRLDAALYAPAPIRQRGQMGRPRVRGKRIASPAWWARRKSTRWEKLDVFVHGRAVTLRVRVIDALWYVAAGSELVRLVLVRDFPGHERDDVFVSTDPSLSSKHIIESFSKRWSLEISHSSCTSCHRSLILQDSGLRAVEEAA